MLVFEIVIALLLAGAALSALARRIGAPYPALVALSGALLAIIPGTPFLQLDPDLALALFVAPVLLDAAFDSSLRDLRRNWKPVAGLAIGAVGLTVIAVALVARALVPGMAWAAAVALGAIVAPPDAAAATAVLKQLRPPHQLMVILEGESLFNDASALIIYRLAVGAAVAGTVVSWNAFPMLIGVTVGSALLGFVASRITFLVTSRIQEISTSVVVQFCFAFGIWLLAERLHLSGILTTVVFAMAAARRASLIMPARIRVPSYAVWVVAVFVLNVLAFILIGLQLKPIVARLDRSAGVQHTWIAVAICATAIAARFVWVMSVTALSAWRCRIKFHRPPGEMDTVAVSPRAAALVGWCGMRGIVTLAAALALPAGGDGLPPFPYRDLILFTAFAVVLGTLVVQGLTLTPLLKKLNFCNDNSVEREVQIARVAILNAALETTSGSSGMETVDLVRQRYDVQLRRAKSELKAAIAAGEDCDPNSRTQVQTVASEDADVVRAAITAERQKLTALRADGTIGDAAFQRVEEELDWRELDLQQLLQP
jgi:Na+/H+ antiporter